MTTTQDRFQAAVKDARAAGVKINQNVMTCCRSCYHYEKSAAAAPADPGPYAFTYGGQGGAYSWVDGEAYDRASLRGGRYWRPTPARTDAILFNHGGPGVQAATVVSAAFQAHGFDVDWDGTDSMTVIVNLPAPDAA